MACVGAFHDGGKEVVGASGRKSTVTEPANSCLTQTNDTIYFQSRPVAVRWAGMAKRLNRRKVHGRVVALVPAAIGLLVPLSPSTGLRTQDRQSQGGGIHRIKRPRSQ